MRRLGGTTLSRPSATLSRRERGKPARDRRLKTAMERRAKAAIFFAALVFIAGQAAFRWALSRYPAIGDREFGRKLDDLRKRSANSRDYALTIMLGSSRVATGFRPDALPPSHAPDGRSMVAFNFAQVGTGPQLAHLVLRRLIAQGVRPDLVLIEFWPPFWASDGYLKGYLDPLNIGALNWSDIRLLARYLSKSRHLYAAWIPSQLTPIFASRFVLLSRLGGSWSPRFDPDRRLENLDSSGWWAPRSTISDDDRRKLVAHYRAIYAKRLGGFRIRPVPDRALHDLLALCRSNGIKAAVVVLPEGESFRDLYSPAALSSIDAYLSRLREDVPIIDARRWVPDAEFSDGHHLLPAGATRFTERLGREALPRIVATSKSVRFR